jgi:hypothetical protein
VEGTYGGGNRRFPSQPSLSREPTVPLLRFISESGEIEWKNVGIYIAALAKKEHSFLLEEYDLREKHEKRIRNNKTETNSEREMALNNLPLMYMQTEKYISPPNGGWESRYYKALLDNETPEKVSLNYCEGLEWVLKYYSGDCPDWQWSYKYNYAPLLSDLSKSIPNEEFKFIKKCGNPYTSEAQLNYVLYKDGNVEPKIEWSYCRYFWEAHTVCSRD